MLGITSSNQHCTWGNRRIDKNSRQIVATRRMKTMPDVVLLHSCMSVRTLNESLHCKNNRGFDDNTGNTDLNSDNTGKTERAKSTRWGTIHIREYERVLGDNPSCSGGPPISIGWAYNRNSISMTLEGYENDRPKRRSMRQMMLPRSVRQEMLMQEWDVSRQQIASAVRSNVRVKSQRIQTLNNLSPQMEKFENILESAGRKLKRLLLLEKRPSKKIEKMRKQAERAQAVIAHMSAEETLAYLSQQAEDTAVVDKGSEVTCKPPENVAEADIVSEADKASGSGSTCGSIDRAVVELTDEKEKDFQKPGKKYRNNEKTRKNWRPQTCTDELSISRRPRIVITEDD